MASPRGAGWARAGATLAVVLVADQATKALVVTSLDRGESTAVLLGLDLTNTRNSGVAFGFLQNSATIVALLIAVALSLLLAYFAAHAERPALWLPVGMLLGGAAGNLVDRVREGAVIDFIDPPAWPAFNVADACIVAGVLVLLYVAERTGDRA